MSDYQFWVALAAVFFSGMAWAAARDSFKLISKTHQIVDVLALRIAEQDEVLEQLAVLAEMNKSALLNLHNKIDALSKV